MLEILPYINGLVIFGLAIMVYCLPTALAFFKSHKHRWAISFLSLILGWTVVFWVACMTWALMNQTEEKANGKNDC